MRHIGEFIIGYAIIVAFVTLSYSFDLPILFNSALILIWPIFLARILFLVLRRLSPESRPMRVLLGAGVGPLLGVITGFPVFFLGGLILGFALGITIGVAMGAFTPNITPRGLTTGCSGCV